MLRLTEHFGRRQKLNNVIDQVGVTDFESVLPYTVGLLNNTIYHCASKIGLLSLAI